MPAEPPAGAPLEVFAACSDWLLVIGGSAVQAYGMARMTFDSDCAILDRDESKLRGALAALGYIVDDHRATYTRYRHLGGQRPIVDAMRFDAGTFAKLWKESRFIVVTGCSLRVPAPLHLVAMKLFALKQQPERAYKDWPDIEFLLSHHRLDWTPEELTGLVERYASEETAAKLRDAGLL